MGILLFVCIAAFLLLFAVNNEAEVVLSSPMALGMVIVITLAAGVAWAPTRPCHRPALRRRTTRPVAAEQPASRSRSKPTCPNTKR